MEKRNRPKTTLAATVQQWTRKDREATERSSCIWHGTRASQGLRAFSPSVART